MALVNMDFNIGGEEDNYDTVAFKSVSSPTVFTTKGKTKAFWVTCIRFSDPRAYVVTNVDPSTNKPQTTNLYYYTYNGGSTPTVEASYQTYVVNNDNSFSMGALSTNGYASLAYTYWL